MTVNKYHIDDRFVVMYQYGKKEWPILVIPRDIDPNRFIELARVRASDTSMLVRYAAFRVLAIEDTDFDSRKMRLSYGVEATLREPADT